MKKLLHYMIVIFTCVSTSLLSCYSLTLNSENYKAFLEDSALQLRESPIELKYKQYLDGRTYTIPLRIIENAIHENFNSVALSSTRFIISDTIYRPDSGWIKIGVHLITKYPSDAIICYDSFFVIQSTIFIWSNTDGTFVNICPEIPYYGKYCNVVGDTLLLDLRDDHGYLEFSIRENFFNKLDNYLLK